MSKRPHVAIIGAGFAGLRCADILIQNGAKVTIFEARDRVGGRVHQAMVGDYLVDMGPNWIHGTGTNPIVNIAEATETTLGDFEGRSILVGSDGRPVGEDVAAKISEFMWATIEEAFRYSNSHQDEIPAERSLLDFIEERLGKTEMSGEEKRLCVESCRLWGAYVGDPVERQSLKFFCLEECIDGNNYFVASTYKNILAQVSSTALQHADIRYSQPIAKIESKPISEDTSAVHEITLTTETGESHTFDEVVVTCPLGWLKRNKSAFTPDLPPRLISAIDSISYGRLEKIYVTFPQAFWKSNTEAAITNGSAKPTPSDPSFAQFLNPSYTEHPAAITWNQECFSMAALPPHTAHPTLLFYTYGPCATHIVETLTSLNQNSSPTTGPTASTPTTNTKTYTFLTTLLQPFYSLLPNYTPSNPSCTPSAILATTWQSDPYAGNGSYCNFQIGLEAGDRDIETLRSGDGIGAERGIWFAGEHTAPFVALGTTTGAFWSGERAAGAICRGYNLGEVGMGVGRDDSLPSAGVFGRLSNGNGNGGS
ncbi:amine oxidase [Aspergillus karnatakaensis]|uniref:flavin monoamine oxidase family protein n=1 Tax=Aspergillus karnatakaensis TaxID=1810916 RepID=UPI003CCCE998